MSHRNETVTCLECAGLSLSVLEPRVIAREVMVDKWAKYDAWNQAIADVIFPELEVPEPVYLDFEDDVLEGLSARLGVDPDRVEAELAAAVVATLPDLGPAGIFEAHMRRTRAWVREGRADVPPFLALLAVFCLAAERMGAGEGMAPSNYFGRLREVLGRDPQDHRIDGAYRRVAEKLWGEHNRWLVELDGMRGLPTAFALTHRFVGLTISQALVRSGDRERLKEFFREYGFSPGAEVAPSELGMVLDSWMAQKPCPASSSLEGLWKRGQARERIAQAAAVALAGWDGSVRERRGRAGGTTTQRGHLALTLEMGAFPRKRFSIQALLYLPQPDVPRDATVLTATPPTSVEVVPDLPGALGLGRGSSLHAGDVLEGMLQIKDALTGQTLERRPRRLVLFREDELSRRWVESPQVMLGDDVRLLVHESLVDRLTVVLETVARPGWELADRYPGQPDGWLVVTGVEIFSHPGDLVSSQSMDDLAPLVPLTSSQLKVAGGFSLPGQIRGKWHTWAPPEIRAVSDAPDGFRVRLTDLHRFVSESSLDEEGTVLEEWTDEGAGVLVQSLAGLELDDGDYRIDLLAAEGEDPLASTTVHLRSADSPDHRQWALLKPVVYRQGAGCLGIETEAAGVEVRGMLVSDPDKLPSSSSLPPARPQWGIGKSSSTDASSPVVRLTVPEKDSCLRTGRHREQIDMVPTDAKGKPLEAWTYGRCSGCGLVRRYPTRLRWNSYGRGRAKVEASGTPARHDVGQLPERDGTEAGQDWATAFDALLHTGGGSWSQLERIALQVEPTALFVDQFARTLEVLGHLDVRRDSRTLEPTSWEVAPTCLAGTSDGFLMAGFWPGNLYTTLGSDLEEAGGSVALAAGGDGLASYFAVTDSERLAEIASIHEVPVVPRAWEDVASALPALSVVLEQLPRQTDSLDGEASLFRPSDNTWAKVPDFAAPGAYRLRRFTTLDFFRTDHDVENGQVARCTVQLGKHLSALADGVPLIAYDAVQRVMTVPLGADLPGLYGRAAVAASGRPPTTVPRERQLRYEDVPPDLAAHLFDLLTR